MNVKIVFSLIFLTISFCSSGQIIDKITFNYGFTNSDLEWEYEEDKTFPLYTEWGNEKIIGFFSGLDLEYLSSNYFSLSTGVGYYQKGATYKFTPRSLKWSLDYLTITTEMKARYNLNGFIPYLTIGPRIDYLLKYSSEFDEFEKLADLKKVNYGLRYGFGVQYDFKKITIGLGWLNNMNFNSVVVNDGELMRPKFSIDDKTMIFKIDFGIKLN